jgi:uncharacterized protein (DUF486 family)
MSVAVRTTLLLVGSNVFMTFAWYAHLKNLNDRKRYIAALASWGIALFEYGPDCASSAWSISCFVHVSVVIAPAKSLAAR